MKKILIGAALLVFIALTAFGATGYFYKPKISVPPELKGEIINLRGTKIRYCQVGEGPDILMIHACPGSIEDFDPILSPLAKNFRITLYDRPGNGYSDNSGNMYTLNYNARIAEDLIAALKLKNVLVLGHSYGSGVALSMAINGNANIRALVLMGCPGYRPVSIDAISYLLGIPYVGKGLSVIASPIIGDDIIRSRLTKGFSPNENSLTSDDMELRVKMWSQPQIPVTRSRELLNLGADLEANSRHYGSIIKRVILIQGKEDWVTKAAWKLHDDIIGSQLIVMEGVGHYPQFAKPDEVVKIIEDTMGISPLPKENKKKEK